MAKFQVDVPEGFDEETPERPKFAFRDAEPVAVGEEATTREETPREKSLGMVLSILLQSHQSIQDADTQLFGLTNFIAQLKTGEASIKNNEDIPRQMVVEIRKRLLQAVVTLDQTLLVTRLEAEGILGNHDGREFAALGLSLVNRIREEFERWDISTDAVPDIPEEAMELMRQAVADMEAEREAASAG